MSQSKDGSIPARRRICFIHMPKCAGTSVYNALRPFYERGRVRHLQPAPARKAAKELGFGLEYRSHILAYHLCEDVDLVFGHYQVTLNIIDAHPEFDFITILRDPVARFISNFYYNHARPEWADSFSGSLDNFLIESSEHPQSLGHNYIRFLGISNPRDDASIEAAKRVLDRFALIGLTEKMNHFCAQFQQRYGIGLELSRTNAGPVPLVPTNEQYARIRDLCSPNMQLYEHAKMLGGL